MSSSTIAENLTLDGSEYRGTECISPVFAVEDRYSFCGMRVTRIPLRGGTLVDIS